MARKTVIQIEREDAERYRKTLMSIRKRMIRNFEKTSDGSLRKWINEHGPVLDELMEELGHRFRD
jgi:flavorubredoxin